MPSGDVAAVTLDSYRCSNCGLHTLIAHGQEPGRCECQNATTFVPDPIPETLGERVRWERKGNRMSLDDLALLTKTSKSHLSEIENGKNLPGITLAVRLAKALGVSLDWLVGDLL